MFNCLAFVSIFLVAVRVEVAGTCTTGAIRYDPKYRNTVIQICFNNRWGYICASSSDSQRKRISNVICQQMGYSKQSDTGTTREWIRNPAPKPLFIRWLNCLNKPIIQQNLLECARRVNDLSYENQYCLGYNSNNAWVIMYYYAAAGLCINTSVCQNGQIQLLDTNAVLLCVNGEWRALSSTTWSSTQAQVVCRQLGNDAKGAMAVNVSVDTGTMSVLPISANFDCLGNENFLYNCSDRDSVSYDNIIPPTTIVAGAICEDLPGPPSNLTVNSQQSDIILHWEYTDDANNLSNFSVHCEHNETVNPQLHLDIKTELRLLTKNNNATLIGLLASTVYTCCVSAVFPYMVTDSTCINVTKGLQEASSSTSSTILSTPFASSSSNGAIPWIGGIFIGIIISAVFVIILLLIIKIFITRRSKDKQFKPHNRSSLQSDNPNVTSTVYQSRGQTQNIGIYSELSQNQFEPFSNGRDPAIPAANDYESPVDVNGITVNDDPVYSLAETEEEFGNYDKLQRN